MGRKKEAKPEDTPVEEFAKSTEEIEVIKEGGEVEIVSGVQCNDSPKKIEVVRAVSPKNEIEVVETRAVQPSNSKRNCEDSLKEIMSGDPSQFPRFVMSLFDFLTEDVPPFHDKIGVAQHIGSRAAHIMAMAMHETARQEEEVEVRRHSVSSVLLLLGCGYALSERVLRIPTSAFILAKLIDTQEFHQNMHFMNINRHWLALAVGWGVASDMETSWTWLFVFLQHSMLWFFSWCVSVRALSS